MGLCSEIACDYSDLNKELLLSVDDFIPLLVDSLLLDPDHPRRAAPDFDAVAPLVQRVRRRRLPAMCLVQCLMLDSM